MNKKFANLQLHQMDSTLTKLRDIRPPSRPSAGWVKAIRESLGMSASAFARKLGVTPSSIAKFEKSEADEKITLASLRKLASALDCELQYTLVPRKSLEEILEDRAIAVAKERLRPISHSMSLENQSVDKAASNKQLQLLAKEILDGPRRNLW
ncbi:MAG: mobile mystery protein A [Polynucleobacter sp.]|uniref:mobile mystery protein A n=1 Tax=Polynucleobacter sp. TaxID=2029855 RepID=UPI0027224903|nr:mobile mystery protein A [Polynucleobacter sp.]MDO8714448.1 mobile mystery protein A [Polynucleobacter sp.]